MEKHKYCWLIVGLLSIVIISCKNKVETIFPVIPQPNSVTFEDGNFRLSDKTVVYTNVNNKEIINSWIADLPTRSVENGYSEQGGINFVLDTISPSLESNEAYEIDITSSAIVIRGSSDAALYYGVQTLIQLYNEYEGNIPAMSIVDSPRFAVRSLMLDASSFYLTPDFIKKQIDAMAHYKFNRLQWLLGGEGGWRILISGYTQLTDSTAWRTVKNFQQMVMYGGEFCSREAKEAYGGYYSEAEIRDIVAYAAARNITVIPSIDLPIAHHKLAQAGNIGYTEQEQKQFVEASISTLLDIYPSEYIYVGNGLAHNTYGTVCKSCRHKIDSTNVLDESEPYTAVLRDAESYLKSRGRKLVAWEESLRMGLSDDATIVSWHDKTDGITAVNRGYNVIMSPADVSSLNFYQSDPTKSPKAMSGFLPLEKLYAFNPIVPEIATGSINGVQVNMWTHMVDSEADIEYMLYPRLLAASEVGWTKPVRKSYLDFKKRVTKASTILSEKSYNCFDLSQESVTRPAHMKPVHSLAKHKPVYYNSMFATSFPANGVTSLTDGVCGGWHYADGGWQGFMGEKMSVTIDLEEVTNITFISASFISDVVGNVFLPAEVQISISDDGDNFEMLETLKNDLPIDLEGYQIVDFGWSGHATARYVKYEARKINKQVSWLFTDEIIIQ